MQPITQKLLSFFNSAKANLSYGKVVRSSLFLLLVVSCAASMKQNPLHAAIVSLIAFIAFDVVCALKRPKYIDFSGDVQTLKDANKALTEKNSELASHVKEIKNDLSIAKISTVMGQARK